MQPSRTLVILLATVIGCVVGFTVESYTHAPTNEVKAPVLAIDPAPSVTYDLVTECQAMLTKAQDIATECYGSVDTLFSITNKLTDIVWDWSWADIKSLRSTPKPEPLTKTVSDSPGQIIMVPQ